MRYIKLFENFNIISESISSYTRMVESNSSETVSVLRTWRSADDFMDNHVKEEIRKEELPKIEWMIDQMVRFYDLNIISTHQNFDSTVQVYEIGDGGIPDGYINVHKFEDEWWLVECYLPHVSSPEGGDHVYFVCDTSDGLELLPTFFKNYITS